MNNEKLEPKNEGFPGSDKPCLCNEKARLMTGSVPLSIFSSKITVHHVPYYFCDHCKRTYFDSVTDIDVVLKRAYRLGLSEIDYVADLSQFKYKIELLDELKLSIEKVLLNNITNVAPGEEFAVVLNSRVVVGYRENDYFVIENVIAKVI